MERMTVRQIWASEHRRTYTHIIVYVSIQTQTTCWQNIVGINWYDKLHITSLKLFISSNGSPSKNPDIKTPLVVSFSLGVIIHFRHWRHLDIRVLRMTPIISLWNRVVHHSQIWVKIGFKRIWSFELANFKVDRMVIQDLILGSLSCLTPQFGIKTDFGFQINILVAWFWMGYNEGLMNH